MKKTYILMFVSIILFQISILNSKEFSKLNLSKEKNIEINLNQMEINEYVKFVAKIIKKNILINTKIEGKINFITEEKLNEEDLLDILISTLELKGYTIVGLNENFLKIVKSTEASEYNLPDFSEDLNQMSIEIFKIDPRINIESFIFKLKPLSTKNAKINTIKETNTVVIMDYPKNIKMIKKVINEVISNKKSVVVIKKLNYISPTGIIKNLVEIGNGLKGRNLLKNELNILSDENTNSLIFIGQTEFVNNLLPYIDTFDKLQEEQEVVVNVIKLKNSNAVSVAELSNKIVTKTASIIKEREKTSSKDLKNENTEEITNPDKISITADKELNTIVVMSTKKDFYKIKKIIESLDIEREQVFIKAKIIEISTNKLREVGTEFGLEAGQMTSNGIYSMAANIGGPSVAISDTILSGFEIGSIKDFLAFGSVINLLNKKGVSQIIDEPSLLFVNNQEGELNVGKRVSILTSSRISETDNTTNNYTREDIGLSMKITPRISEDNKVYMNINIKLEDALNSLENSVTPTTTKREFKTNAIVSNGENVVIGGLVRDSTNKVESKIPFIGDIPFIGNAFKNDNTNMDSTNLLIVLTPYIINKNSNLSEVRRKLSIIDILQKSYNRIIDKTILKKDSEGNLKIDIESKKFFEDVKITSDNFGNVKVTNEKDTVKYDNIKIRDKENPEVFNLKTTNNLKINNNKREVNKNINNSLLLNNSINKNNIEEEFDNRIKFDNEMTSSIPKKGKIEYIKEDIEVDKEIIKEMENKLQNEINFNEEKIFIPNENGDNYEYNKFISNKNEVITNDVKVNEEYKEFNERENEVVNDVKKLKENYFVPEITDIEEEKEIGNDAFFSEEYHNNTFDRKEFIIQNIEFE